MLKLFRNTVYVRIKPDRLSVLHVESGKELSEVPDVAIEQKNGKSSVVAVGHDAAAKSGHANIVVANGFKHPRTLIADFTVAEQALKHFLKLLQSGSFLTASPVLVIHPQAALEGGLTQVEIRAFAELGLGAGARKVYLWEGPELSREALHELRFSNVGGKLLYP